MKCQLHEIIVIIFSILISLISYFAITSKYIKEIEKGEEKRIIEIFDKIRDISISFLKLSLYYSTTQQFREEYHTWIHNGPNPLDFNELKECKEKFINFSINVYFSKMEFNLPLKIEKKYFQYCKLNISEENVNQGFHDEGNYSVTCYDASLNLYTNDTQLIEFINTTDFISNNRYWYLYRKIQEWSNEAGNVFASCICALTKSCADCNQVKKCYDIIFEMLKNKFKDDDYVSCRKSNICCYNEPFFDCSWDNRCIEWSKNKCFLKKDYECSLKSISFSNFFSKSNSILFFQSSQSFSCKIPLSYRLETSSIFICEDRKYYESFPAGTTPIKFSIGIFSGFEVKCANCYIIDKCEVSKNYCENCKEIENNQTKNICENCEFPCPNSNCKKAILRCENCTFENSKVEECKNCKCISCIER
jgi:hypothetical protein